MKMMKRVLAATIALVLMMTAVGCSTPKNAAKVGDVNISTGEYLAYLYSNTMSMYNVYMQYMGDASAMWEQSLPYENVYDFSEDAKKDETSTTDASTSETSAADENNLIMEEYLKQETKDQIVYLMALQSILEENGLKISDEDLAEAEAYMTGVDTAGLLENGISEESFKKMYINTTYLEDTVFMGLYGTEGKQATKQADIDKYFADNYIAYEIIQVSLVDSNKEPLSDSEIAEKKEELEGYRNVFYATGNFDVAIEAYDTATTVNSDGEIPELDKEKYNVDYDGAPVEDVTPLTSNNVMVVDTASEDADQDLVKMVRSIDVGDAEILEYNQNGGSKMAALVYRVNPADVKVNPNGYSSDDTDTSSYVALSENVKDSIISAMHEKDFEALVKAKMDEQKDTVSFDSRAIKMCDPKDFFN